MTPLAAAALNGTETPPFPPTFLSIHDSASPPRVSTASASTAFSTSSITTAMADHHRRSLPTSTQGGPILSSFFCLYRENFLSPHCHRSNQAEIGSNCGMGLRLGFLVILLMLTRARGGAAAGSEAYVMLLYGDEFLLGIRILGKSIWDTGSTKDMAVLISDGVSDFTKRLLQKWVEIIGQTSKRVDVLKDQDVIRTILNILQNETLKLIETFVDKAEDQPHIGKQFVPPMMDPVLGDYVKNVADARESEVLSLFATITNKA